MQIQLGRCAAGLATLCTSEAARKDNHFVDGANLLELSSLDRATPESQVHSCDRGWALLQVEPAGWRSTSSMAGIHEFFVWSAQSTQPRLWTTRSAFSKPAYLSL